MYMYSYTYIYIYIYRCQENISTIWYGSKLKKWTESAFFGALNFWPFVSKSPPSLQKLIFNHKNKYLVGGLPTPLKNDGVRQLGSWHSQYMESRKIHVPNHQPDTHHWSLCIFGWMFPFLPDSDMAWKPKNWMAQIQKKKTTPSAFRSQILFLYK